MAKLYPPYIKGTIPAFIYEKGGTVITVPFSMNRAVNESEIKGYSLRIKDLNGELIGTVSANNAVKDDNTYQVHFVITNSAILSNFLIRQFYKIQIAYKDKYGNPGYYSTIGITKCISKPEVYIEDLELGTVNYISNNYIGVYRQSEDFTEKLYKYSFNLYDKNSNLLETTGDKIHYVVEDESESEARENYSFERDLSKDNYYLIQFEIETINGYKSKSPKYKITSLNALPSEINIKLTAKNEFDNGRIILRINPKEKEAKTNIHGMFLISRKSSLEENWKELKRLNLYNEPMTTWSYIDYTIEQGVDYQYSIQEYNKIGIYSTRIVSNKVEADFEDMFLYDGEKQLKIRYNPKVSTFKRNVLENKTDTIGSKFPFISRNGITKYHEFSLSGLISYRSDEEESFVSKKDLFKNLDENFVYEKRNETMEKYYSNNEPDFIKENDLIKENFLAERIFKLKVYDFLTDGKPKLLKTAAEGNYIVRLLNVSFAPTDSLSRMVHTFSATAYEIADNSFESLGEFNLINNDDELDEGHLSMEAVEFKKILESLSEEVTEEDYVELLPEGKEIYIIDLRDMKPGTMFTISYGSFPPQTFMIGNTGAYYFKSDVPINSLQLKKKDIDIDGYINFSFKENKMETFMSVEETKIDEVPIVQFIGNDYIDKGERGDNLLDLLRDYRTLIANFYFIRFWKRQIRYLYVTNKKTEKLISFEEAIKEFLEDVENGSLSMLRNYSLYYDMNCTDLVTSLDNLQKDIIYRIRVKKRDYLNENSEYDSPIQNDNSLWAYEPFSPKNDMEKRSNYIANPEGLENFHEIHWDFINEKEKDEIIFGPILEDSKKMGIYLDAYNLKIIKQDLNQEYELFNVKVRQAKNSDYTTINLADKEYYDLKFNKLDGVESIVNSVGVVTELGYSQQIIKYAVEDTDLELKEIKQICDDKKQEFLNKWKWEEKTELVDSLELVKEACLIEFKENYENYLTLLEMRVKG